VDTVGVKDSCRSQRSDRQLYRHRDGFRLGQVQLTETLNEPIQGDGFDLKCVGAGVLCQPVPGIEPEEDELRERGESRLPVGDGDDHTQRQTTDGILVDHDSGADFGNFSPD
jgi:hypothetical protein